MNRTEAIICAVILAMRRVGYHVCYNVAPKALAELDQAEAKGLKPTYPEVAAAIATVHGCSISDVCYGCLSLIHREVGGV